MLRVLKLVHDATGLERLRALTARVCRDAASLEGTVQLTSMETTASPATCLAACADRSRAVIGTSSGRLLLVSVSNQTEPQLTQSDLESIASASDTSPEHDLSEPVGDSTATLAVMTLPEQHAAAVTSAQLSPDCRNLATISAEDGAVFVWDTLPGSQADLYVASKATIAGACCAAWLPGKRLLVGSSSSQLVVSPQTETDITAPH